MAYDIAVGVLRNFFVVDEETNKFFLSQGLSLPINFGKGKFPNYSKLTKHIYFVQGTRPKSTVTV